MRWYASASVPVTDADAAAARIDAHAAAQARVSADLTAYLAEQGAEVRWTEVRRSPVRATHPLPGVTVYRQWAEIEVT